MRLLVFLYSGSLIRAALSILCEVGEALKDPTNPAMDRSCNVGFQSCPGDYICISQPGSLFSSSVCCPSKSVICSQPLVAGSACGAAVSSTGYYFDANYGSCQTFTYNGCFGNNNNFHSREDCERSCLSSLCRRGTPARTNTGVQQCQFGSNQCPQNFECVATTSVTIIGSVCCPSTASICNQPMQSGMACSANSQPMQRYYYDWQSRMCYGFVYHGCGGNDNSFGTIQECLQFCAADSQLCPANTMAAPGVTASMPCSSSAQCPQDYSCQYSPGQRQRYCCSNNNPLGTGQLCPVGSFAAPWTSFDTPCNPYSNSCPVGYSCQASWLNGQSYCCSTGQQLCPDGGVAAPGVTAATPCDQYSICQPGYTCQYSRIQRQSYCCYGGRISARLCPLGSVPAGDQPCQSNAQCPNGFACQPSINGQSYCCSSNQPPGQLCPSGSYAGPGVSVITPCFSSVSCPMGFTCQFSPFNRRRYCCSERIDSWQQYCPAGSTVAPWPSFNRHCSPYHDQCSAGYTCQRSPVTHRWHCCSTPNPGLTLCPLGSSPAPGTTLTSTCNFYTGCALGYTCQVSPYNGRSYCCQSGPSQWQLCPIGTMPEPSANPNAPCFSSAACQSGYTCQKSPANAYSYCCSGTSLTPVYVQLCPPGSTAALGTTVDSPCSGTLSCPIGYSCQLSPASGLSYCCSQTQIFAGLNDQCPQGASPLFYPNIQQPVSCTLNGQPCQYPYTCQVSPGATTGVCCLIPDAFGGSGEQDCPIGTPVVQNNAQITYCSFGSTPQPQLCPPLSLCLMSRPRQVFICCYTYRNFPPKVPGDVPGPTVQCESDEDCQQASAGEPGRQQNQAKCINGKCQAPSDIEGSSEEQNSGTGITTVEPNPGSTSTQLGGVVESIPVDTVLGASDNTTALEP